jgi:hypothetical protein
MDTTTPPFASIGIDIGKEVLHIVGFNIGGKIAFPRKIRRLALGDIMLGVEMRPRLTDRLDRQGL